MRTALSSTRTASTSDTLDGVPPPVLWLEDPGASDIEVSGAKAANLARAAAAGLPVLPGFVVTTGSTGDGLDARALSAARDAHELLERRTGIDAVVVRSSSTVEDTSTSSMAGQFTSVLDVRGWDAVTDAIGVVNGSAARPKGRGDGAQPMAVLVQPLVTTSCAGVLFGLDPVSGDAHHLVVEVVPGNPDALVSGAATALHGVLTRRGHLRSGSRDPVRGLLDHRRRRQLATLARDAAAVFGGPQDIEWAFDPDGRLWLLQSRDVTAHGEAATARGPVLGPGPVAETFPDPLRPLEVELWLAPLREGVVGALHVTGAVPSRRLASSPVVLAVGGRAAADLELFGIAPSHRARRLINPLRGGRRLLAAWRVGRLRSALPGLIEDVLTRIDDDLAAAPVVEDLDDHELLDLIDGATRELVALHGHEVLAGMLLPADGGGASLPTVALDALGRARGAGLDDDAAAARFPVVLALVPPAIGRPALLPAGGAGADGDGIPSPILDLTPRDALRLRCRWVQELSGRAAEELGGRLVARELLGSAADLPELCLTDLRDAVAGARRPAIEPSSPGPPLPTAFRLVAGAHPVAVTPAGADHDGLPAAAGRACGTVTHDPDGVPETGGVLVVDVLDPRLAGVLGRLSGLVSESGSALSHLAILAREQGVPTVVAVADARRRFPPGTRLLVDGDTGDLTILDGRP